MKRFPIGYKDTIGFEIECHGVNFELVEMILQHLKNENKIDSGWSLDIEASVENGIEVKSPIMDRKQKWGKEVSIICKMLKELGATVDQRCGFHIHFGGQILEENARYFQNMILLWCHMEHDFILKTKGNGQKIRTSLWNYARPLKYSLNDKEKDLLVKDYDSYDQFLYDFQKFPFSKIYALNFQNLNYAMNTIEIRCPAGTLDETVIFHYIALFSQFFKTLKTLTEEERIQYYQELKMIPSYNRNGFSEIPYQKLFSEEKKSLILTK